MNETLQKFLSGLVLIGLATAVLLPGRQTPQVIGAVDKLVRGGLRTSITGK